MNDKAVVATSRIGNCPSCCWCGTAPPTVTTPSGAVASWDCYHDWRDRMHSLAVAIRRLEVLRGFGGLL